MTRTQLIANYVPGKSFLHSLHPSTKIIIVLGMLLVVFFLRDIWLLLLLLMGALALVVWTGTIKNYIKSMIILLPIIFGLLFFQCVAPAFPKPWTVIAHVGPFTIYHEGAYHGIVLALRILTVASYALSFVMTTHPVDLFVTLRAWKVPYELCFMIITTLQLIPILQKEMNVIISAQRSRAMPATGFRALLPSIVPVFAGAIERVRQMSMTLESRAFGSSGHKTSIRKLRVKTVDYILTIISIILLVMAVWLIIINKGFDQSAEYIFPVAFAYTLFFGSVVGFLAVLIYFARQIGST
jgi:energy-coupling factor transport system permease protein